MIEKKGVKEFLDSIGKQTILEHEAKSYLKGLGLRVPEGFFLKKGAGLLKSRPLDFPLAAKAQSRLIRSKTEARAVKLGIRNIEELESAIRELVRVEGAEGVLVEEMLPDGIETVVGGISDPQFGPVIMFGVGGFLVEALRDVAFALAPATMEQARWLISQVKGHQILKGIRGRPPVDMEAIAKALLVVSELMATELIEEIDINPLAAYPDGAVVLDAKIFVKA